jgi:predicted DNA-binding transcriptional regulator YafY
VTHGKTVTFNYAKGGGRVIEPRRLAPESVEQVGNHLTVTGYDPDRNSVRAYRSDRIKGQVSVQ